MLSKLFWRKSLLYSRKATFISYCFLQTAAKQLFWAIFSAGVEVQSGDLLFLRPPAPHGMNRVSVAHTWLTHFEQRMSGRVKAGS